MSLDLRQLRAFIAIVDTGSVGQAAVQIGMSQSALSRLMQTTEARLGAKLFERTFSGMTLTPYGEAFEPHARLLVFEMSQATEAIDALRGLRRGTARVGAVATIARTILPRAVEALMRSAPGLKVELLEAADDRLVTALKRREVDIMIAGEIAAQDEIMPVGQCRFDDNYAPFCAMSHPLAQRERVTLVEALQERWTMPAEGTTPRTLFTGLLQRAGHRMPIVSVETWSPSAMIAFVRDTHMLGWLPRPLLSGEEAAGMVKVLEIGDLMLARNFYLYRRTRGIMPSAAQKLIEQLPLIKTAGSNSLIFGVGVTPPIEAI